MTRSRLWPVAGLAVHAANGALFGLAYRELQVRTGYEPRRLAVGLALAEHAALFPLFAVVDRVQPASGEPGVPRGLADEPARVRAVGLPPRAVRPRARAAGA